MKRKLLLTTAVLSITTTPLLVTACGVNTNVNHENYHHSDGVVNLADCSSLFTKGDLIYSYLTVNVSTVSLNVFSILKYNIRSIAQSDYLISFTTLDGKRAMNLNIVGTYRVTLTATENNEYLRGSLTLNLIVVDDRVNIGQVDYDETNWHLSSRNTLSDLFKKFEMAIYLVVRNANYHLGDFLKITIYHQDKIYTNDDQNSGQKLDINSAYFISATSQDSDNTFINGELTKQLKIIASDERQTVKNLNNQIFSDYHPDNLIDNGRTLYQGVRMIIDNLYTLDATTQSDFKVVIKSKNDILNDDETKLTSLSYEVIIDATNSKYLKDINASLTIEIIDKVIHLEGLLLDSNQINPNVAMQAKTLKAKVLQQVGIMASFADVQSYLVVDLIQDGSKITDDEQYLIPTTVKVKVTPDQSLTTQYFGGILDTNLSVVDNRFDLADSSIVGAIQRAVLNTGFNTLNSFGDLKNLVLDIITKLESDTNPDFDQTNITLADLDIGLTGYSDDATILSESANLFLTIKANSNSHYLKNTLEPIKININYATKKDSFITVPMTPVEFVDYDNSGQVHVMTQVDDTTIAVYEKDSIGVKYKIPYLSTINMVLDYKVSLDGQHDYWVMQTKLEDDSFRIDYYIDNQIVATNDFEGIALIANINKTSEALYLRPDISSDHSGVGNLYQMKAGEGLGQVDLSSISSAPFKIDLIRSVETTNQVYLQSGNQVYLVEPGDETSPKIKPYDISDDYFFDYDKQNNFYELKQDGLYKNDELINAVGLNSQLLLSLDNANYKFISNFTVDEENNFYYLYRDNATNTYSVVKNQTVVFTITDATSLTQTLKVAADGTWQLTMGANIYTNERENNNEKA